MQDWVYVSSLLVQPIIYNQNTFHGDPRQFEYQTFMKGEMYIVSVWLENCQT